MTPTASSETDRPAGIAAANGLQQQSGQVIDQPSQYGATVRSHLHRPSWYQSVAVLGLLGSLLYWASLPPVGWSLLAWVAPLPWLALVVQPQLVGRRPLTVMYFCGFVFWMGTLQWLRLPHWATTFGWVTLSAYLAVYPLLFVALSRVAVHRAGWSIVLAAPVVWTGLDVVRGYLFGGFTLSSLAHTQYRSHTWIQLADLIGCYGLGGIVVLAPACVIRTLPVYGQRSVRWPCAVLALALGLPLAYGTWRDSRNHSRPGATVALVQGTIDTTFDDEPGKDARVMRQYAEITQKAAEAGKRRAERGERDIDLVVWPESMFRAPLVSFSRDYQLPEEMKRWARGRSTGEIESQSRAAPGRFFSALGKPVLVGAGREHLMPERQQRFNSAIFVGADGQILGVYDKTHLVMFGEYVPLFDLWPSLYRLTPMGEGLTAGEHALAQTIGGVRFSPTICYETVIPHLYRRQIHELRAQGNEPDVLVNLTNDGWFWGSSELDLHLICGVFRAVECRKPLLIAANTGFSAWIDAAGRVVEQGPRRETGFILADVAIDDRRSFYLDYGGWLEWLYVLPSLVLAGFGWWKRGEAASQES